MKLTKKITKIKINDLILLIAFVVFILVFGVEALLGRNLPVDSSWKLPLDKDLTVSYIIKTSTCPVLKKRVFYFYEISDLQFSKANKQFSQPSSAGFYLLINLID